MAAIPLEEVPQSLEILVLASNQIFLIPDNLAQSLPNLKVLDLRNNRIE